MTKTQRFTIMAIVVLSCLGCDQVSKQVAQDSLAHVPPKTFFGETVRLEYAENSGAFLSLGSDLSKNMRTLLFTVLSSALLVGLFLYIIYNRQLNRKHILALSLILGGGASNILDRILNDGRVIDFMNVGIGNLRTGIFNLADVVIMLGMALVIVFNVRSHREAQAEADSVTGKDVDDSGSSERA